MKKLLTTIALLGSSALLSVSAMAQQPSADTKNSEVNATAPSTGTAGSMTRADAKNEKNEAKAEYKARKKVADANKELNKADCETALDGGAERACKKTAGAAAKTDKAAAKTVYEGEKADIKSKQQ
jgi:hypothetical protein